MKIGIDFDNTLANYDKIFHQVALKEGLISSLVPKRKKAVKHAVVETVGEKAWSHIQGEVYGKFILEAEPYDGALGFIQECLADGISCTIVSHKTKYTTLGKSHNLQESAKKWLKHHLPEAKLRVYFEESRSEKIARLSSLRCTHFIDDLEDIFAEEGMPERLVKILFDPEGKTSKGYADIQASSWRQIRECFFGELKQYGVS